MEKSTVDMDKIIMDASMDKSWAFGGWGDANWWDTATLKKMEKSRFDYIKDTLKGILKPNSIGNFGFLEPSSIRNGGGSVIKEYNDLSEIEQSKITKERFEKITSLYFLLPKNDEEIGVQELRVWKREPRPYNWNEIGRWQFGSDENIKTSWGGMYRNPLGGIASKYQLNELSKFFRNTRNMWVIEERNERDIQDAIRNKEKFIQLRKEIKEEEEKEKKEKEKEKKLMAKKELELAEEAHRVSLLPENIYWTKWAKLEDEIPEGGKELQKLKKVKIEELILRLKEFPLLNDRKNFDGLTDIQRLEKRLNQIGAIKGKGGRPKKIKDTTEIDKIIAQQKIDKSVKKAEKEKIKAEKELKKQKREEEKLKKNAFLEFKKQAKINKDAEIKKEKEVREKKTAERMAKKKTDTKPKAPRSEKQLEYLAKLRLGKLKKKQEKELIGKKATIKEYKLYKATIIEPPKKKKKLVYRKKEEPKKEEPKKKKKLVLRKKKPSP